MSLSLIKNYFILTVFLLLQLTQNGSAIKCFVCDSTDNPSCADLESNRSIVAEECSLDKMKSIDTWLFDLNKLYYFDTGANKSPLMNCQKVVAKDPKTNKMVTARFCQLNTGESDACYILRMKLKLSPAAEEDTRMAQNNLNGNNNNNNNNNNGRQLQQQQQQSNDAEQFHCSICTTDNCNGADSRLSRLSLGGLALTAATMLTLRIQLNIFRLC
ncbi:hypothetical protein DOY81_006875 [Sarcophaga bullata]|nr:hypothetical protein DOY81_006875 [Sarcophaga bullata]